MHLSLWCVVLVCHQYDVYKIYVGSVYVDRYGGLSGSGLGVFRELCIVSLLVVSECLPVLSLSVVMSYVNCGDYG